MELLGKLHFPAAATREGRNLRCANDQIGKIGICVRFQSSVNNQGVSAKAVAVHTKKKPGGREKVRL